MRINVVFFFKKILWLLYDLLFFKTSGIKTDCVNYADIMVPIFGCSSTYCFTNLLVSFTSSVVAHIVEIQSWPTMIQITI